MLVVVFLLIMLEYALNAVNQGVTALGIKGSFRSTSFMRLFMATDIYYPSLQLRMESF